MTDETIVAVFDTATHAEAAIASLKSAGVPASPITMHFNPTGMSTTTTTAAPHSALNCRSPIRYEPDMQTELQPTKS